MDTRDGPLDAQKRLVRRYMMLVWNAGEFERMDEFVRPDYVGHDPIMGERGSAATVKQLGQIHRDCPDAMFVIEDMIAEGDKVVARWSFTGTHKWSRKQIEMSGMWMSRIEHGRIAESWIERDSMMLVAALAPTDFLSLLLSVMRRLRL